MTAIGPLR